MTILLGSSDQFDAVFIQPSQTIDRINNGFQRFACDQLTVPQGLRTHPHDASFPLAAMHYLPHLTA